MTRGWRLQTGCWVLGIGYWRLETGDWRRSGAERGEEGHADQIRRASNSVVANIVEGYGHKDTSAKAQQFWRISMGSANEVIEHLETAVDLGYVPQATCQPHIDAHTTVAKLPGSFVRSWCRAGVEE